MTPTSRYSITFHNPDRNTITRHQLLYTNQEAANSAMTMQAIIPDYISMIRESNDIDEQVRLLEELNAQLPEEKRLLFPSLFTKHYVSKAVNTIEELWFDRIMMRKYEK